MLKFALISVACILFPNWISTQRLGEGASDWYMRFHDYDIVKRNYEEPVVKTFHIDTSIQYRYAISTVRATVCNSALIKQVFNFGFVMPISAFVSNVTLQSGNQTIKSTAAKSDWVKDNLWADMNTKTNGNGNGGKDQSRSLTKDQYDLVSKDNANFKKFVLPLHLSPNSTAELTLVFEYLMERSDGLYEYALTISPGQLVEDFQVSLDIIEENPISGLNISVPVIGEITPDVIESSNHVNLVFNMSLVEQFHYFGMHGFTGELKVGYSVNCFDNDLDLTVNDGYFLHFYSLPVSMDSIPKHVIFLLDTSFSMVGPKMDHAKDSLIFLIDELGDRDYFNVLFFDENVTRWKDLYDNSNHTVYPTGSNITSRLQFDLSNLNSSQSPMGSDLSNAVKEAIKLDQAVWESNVMSDNYYTLIVLLTDGHSYRNYSDQVKELSKLKYINSYADVPTFVLGMGFDSNMNFLEKVARKTGGATANVIEDLEVEPQLKSVQAHLDDIVLKDLKLNYVGKTFDKLSLTKRNTKVFSKGSSLAVAGKLNGSVNYPEFQVEITGQSSDGSYVESPPTIALYDADNECQGEIMLCSEFQLKGHCISLDMSRANLREFSNQAASLSITGNCSWLAFDKVYYQGEQVQYNPGLHEALPKLHKMISSLRKAQGNEKNLAEEDEKKDVLAGSSSEKRNILERVWAYLTIRDVMAKIKLRPGKINSDLLVSSANLALKFNFLTPFTDIYFVDNGENENDDSAVEPDGQLVQETFLTFGDLNPIMFSIEDPDILRGWEALKSCKSPVNCSGNFHFEKLPEILDSYGDDDRYQMLNCTGSISLFTKPKFMGEQLEVSVSLHQLYHAQSSQRMRSLQTKGDCCWLLFDQRFYAGNVEKMCGNSQNELWMSNVGSVKRIGPIHT